MNELLTLDRHVCILGPPGAGKSTIARAVAMRVGARFNSIDKWAGIVYPPAVRSQAMTDAQVDEALLLMSAEMKDPPAVWEFAHHDYIGLFKAEVYPVLTTAHKILVVADVMECLARNARRPSPVRPAYVEKSWRAARDFLAASTGDCPMQHLLVDTSIMPPEDAVRTTLEYLKENRA